MSDPLNLIYTNGNFSLIPDHFDLDDLKAFRDAINHHRDHRISSEDPNRSRKLTFKLVDQSEMVTYTLQSFCDYISYTWKLDDAFRKILDLWIAEEEALQNKYQ